MICFYPLKFSEVSFLFSRIKQAGINIACEECYSQERHYPQKCDWVLIADVMLHLSMANCGFELISTTTLVSQIQGLMRLHGFTISVPALILPIFLAVVAKKQKDFE